jgi:hypothetical protein
MVIIDSQVHIWEPDSPLRPRPPVDKTLFKPGQIHDQEPLDVCRLLREKDAAGVDRAIVVPPLWEGHRNDVASEGALLYPDRFAIMGKLPEHTPEYSTPRLAGWKKQPGMLGLRITSSEEQRSWLADGTVDWLWPDAERHQIPLVAKRRHFDEASLRAYGCRRRRRATHQSVGRLSDLDDADREALYSPEGECAFIAPPGRTPRAFRAHDPTTEQSRRAGPTPGSPA